MVVASWNINRKVAPRRPARTLDIFYILIWIEFTQVFIYVKTYQSVDLMFVHITKYKLYLKEKNGKTMLVSCNMKYVTQSENVRGRNDQTQ